jgi:methyl-accepting chemotaxis protein
MPVLIQTLLIVTVVVGLATIAVTLFFSHKIAGPLFRVKKVMQELAGGDFSSDFHIRELDQLQELANTFNSTIKETRERIQAIKDGLNSLRDGLNKISDDEIAENKRVLLSELKKVSEVLVMVSRYFKTVC